GGLHRFPPTGHRSGRLTSGGLAPCGIVAGPPFLQPEVTAMTSLLDSTAVAAQPVTAPTHGKARKELAAAGIGGGVEGFDWMIYAVMAPYFAIQIFPGDSPVAKLLAAYLGFAVGFIARPLGSILIGRWADRRGRRSALVLSMVSIAAANLVIALTPTA